MFGVFGRGKGVYVACGEGSFGVYWTVVDSCREGEGIGCGLL